MDKLKLLWSDLLDALRGGCWLNHDWQPTIKDGMIEQVCQKCGKRVVRDIT